MLSSAKLYARWAGSKNYGSSTPLPFSLTRPGTSLAVTSFGVVPDSLNIVGNLGKAPDLVFSGDSQRELGVWTLGVSTTQASNLPSQLLSGGRVDGTLQDIWLVCEYDTQAVT